MTYAQEREFISLFEALESQIADIEFEYAMEADGEDVRGELSDAVSDVKTGNVEKGLGKVRAFINKFKNDLTSKDPKTRRKASVKLGVTSAVIAAIITAMLVIANKRKDKKCVKIIKEVLEKFKQYDEKSKDIIHRLSKNPEDSNLQAEWIEHDEGLKDVVKPLETVAKLWKKHIGQLYGFLIEEKETGYPTLK